MYKLNENEKYKAEHGRDQYSKRDLDRIKQTAAQIIDGYYAFYLLNPNVDSKRVGNFLDESSITERVNDTEDWYSKWGITHEILMKIFRDNGNYKHSTYVIDDDSSEYSIRRIIDDNSLYGVLDTEITNIHNSVYHSGSKLCWRCFTDDHTRDNICFDYRRPCMGNIQDHLSDRPV